MACELDGRVPESRILLAAPLALEELRELFQSDIAVEEIVAWDGEAKAVAARRRERLGAIVLRESRLAHPDPALVTRALLDGIRREGLEALPWSESARRTRERITFVRTLDPRWPDVSDPALLEDLAYDDQGQLLTTTFMDYLLPTAMEMPPAVRVVFRDDGPSPHNPLGAKGAGEGGIIAVPAAVANAVADALRAFDVSVNALPLSPERVRALLRARRER